MSNSMDLYTYFWIAPKTELPLTNNVGIAIVRMLLDFIDSFSVIVFATEIVLKWIDNFRNFWKNPWNVFDFIVTGVVSLVGLLFQYYGLILSLQCYRSECRVQFL